jgi:hypothetical protein
MCKMLFYESRAFDATQILHLMAKGAKGAIKYLRKTQNRSPKKP